MIEQIDLEGLRFLDRLEIGGAIGEIAADFTYDPGARLALQEEVVLAVGQSLVREDRADADPIGLPAARRCSASPRCA